MKNCIRKDLSKIPVPAAAQCGEVLDKAVAASDHYEMAAYVVAFTISSYVTSSIRTGKLFNPLLGLEVLCRTGLS